MKAQDHPQFDQERARLDTTLTHIRQRLGRGFQPTGGDAWANQCLTAKESEYRTHLKEAEKSAYVGRVDVQNDGKREVYYIGKHLLDFPEEARVFSWASPQIGEWYYRGSPDRLLKRSFVIEQSDLQIIHDEFVHQGLLDDIKENWFTDSLLHRLLSENRAGALHDIVATIQEQQYRIIQSPIDRLLVIQGAAGSGKSSIALHRVAYLLFHHREGLRRIVVLGPNRIFMEYTASVLPALGERDIPQRTVDDMLLEMLDTQIEYQSMDESIETLMSESASHQKKLVHYHSAQLKGSLKMASMLERYSKLLDTSPNMADKTLFCSVKMMSWLTRKYYSAESQKTAEDIAKINEEYCFLPLNKKRDEVKRKIVSGLNSELFTRLRDTMRRSGAWTDDYENGGFRRGVERQIERTVAQYLKDWMKLDVPSAYRELLGNRELLARAGKDIFDSAELALLAEAPSKRAPFKFCDLPALAYLSILLNGTDVSDGKKAYDHIVVDEAQDLSPMHFRVLSRLMRRVSMTVLGDLVQGIYMHSGINAWKDLEQATGQKLHQETITQSYRSTHQITEFSNSMLRRAGVDEAQLAEPIARLGARPTLHGHSNAHDLSSTVLQLIRQDSREGHRSIAVICKTAARCAALARRLSASGLRDYHLLTDRDAAFATGVTIIPSYLAKGLEFDSVILADADERTYPADKLGATRLLYVALTRATHALHICWEGTLTPLLDRPQR